MCPLNCYISSIIAIYSLINYFSQVVINSEIMIIIVISRNILRYILIDIDRVAVDAGEMTGCAVSGKSTKRKKAGKR